MASVSFAISQLKNVKLLAAQIARTAGAVAAGIDGLPVVLKADETGALQVTVASGTVTVVVTPPSAAFTSSNGNVGAVSAQIVAANASRKSVTIQNTHATQTLYLSYTNPATANDIALGPGSSILIQNPAPTNAIYGLGSGAATTFAITEA